MLTANSEAKVRDDNEWQGFIQTIKTFIQAENMNLNQKISKLIKGQVTDTFANQMDLKKDYNQRQIFDAEEYYYEGEGRGERDWSDVEATEYKEIFSSQVICWNKGLANIN